MVVFTLGSVFYFEITALEVRTLSLSVFSMESAWEIFGLFLLGAFICLLFGTPCLLLIDKYFARFRSRYIIGGAFGGWVAWFFMCGPLLTPSPWLEWRSWVLSGINHVGLYVALGCSSGTLFTLTLWLRNRQLI